jgi:hypothetical protein
MIVASSPRIRFWAIRSTPCHFLNLLATLCSSEGLFLRVICYQQTSVVRRPRPTRRVGRAAAAGQAGGAAWRRGGAPSPHMASTCRHDQVRCSLSLGGVEILSILSSGDRLDIAVLAIK